jgi:hypothetical protein
MHPVQLVQDRQSTTSPARKCGRAERSGHSSGTPALRMPSTIRSNCANTRTQFEDVRL